MVSVAGLAPARVGLKTRLRDLLCIHGRFQKLQAPRSKFQRSSNIQASKLHGSHGHTFELWCLVLFWSLEVGIWSLASRFARLVSEERPERRDDGHESGGYEITDHCLDVFVSGGRFFVEQVALFADHPATQRRLHQLVHAEAFAHPLTSIAACPLAPRTVSQRPGVALTVTDRFYDVAQRTTRAWDHAKVTVGSNCTFTVNPTHFMAGDAVVATVPEAFGFCTERGNETMRDEF